MNNKEKVLKILFEDSYSNYHIRKLAKLTDLSPNTIINITNDLEKDNIVIKNKDEDTSRILIKPNYSNNKFKLLKQFYNIQNIYDSGLVEYLEEELSYPAVVLFGSYFKAENRINSDIDIFVVSDKVSKINLESFEKYLKKEIQIFIKTKEEFKEMKKKSKELLNNVFNGYILSGYLEIL